MSPPGLVQRLCIPRKTQRVAMWDDDQPRVGSQPRSGRGLGGESLPHIIPRYSYLHSCRADVRSYRTGTVWEHAVGVPGVLAHQGPYSIYASLARTIALTLLFTFTSSFRLPRGFNLTRFLCLRRERWDVTSGLSGCGIIRTSCR